MAKHTLLINGQNYSVDVSDDTPVLWVLRDHIQLLGTKYSCGIGQCGTCTIHLDGEAAKSCTLTIGMVGGREITTIEGLSKSGNHPVQKAWKEVDVPQCGYCQSGQMMTASAFLEQNSNPSREQIREAMHGNICRCASYNRIEKAVEVAAKLTR